MLVAGLLDRATAQRYASWFRALADPSRVQIVEYLARQGRPMPVGEIVTAVGLAQSTVSQHLKILAEVRFVLGRGRALHLSNAAAPTSPEPLSTTPLPAAHTNQLIR